MKLRIKTYNWMPVNESLFIANGVDNVVRLDGTNKDAQYEAKKPKWALFHAGRLCAICGTPGHSRAKCPSR